MRTCWEALPLSFLDNTFNFGKDVEEELGKDVVTVFDDMYTDIADSVNNKANTVIRTAAPAGTPDANTNIPSTTDVDYRNGTIWVVQDSAVGPITAEVYIKAETVVSGGNKTALWVRLA